MLSEADAEAKCEYTGKRWHPAAPLALFLDAWALFAAVMQGSPCNQCVKQDQEPLSKGVPETLRGLGPILSMAEHTGASLAVALGLELRTDSVCFCGSFCCSSFREGKGFLVHVPSGPNLARQGHGHCALTCRHHTRMCSMAATIAAALGHPQATKKCEFFQGTVPGQHCSVLSSAWLGDSARYNVRYPNLQPFAHTGCLVGSLLSTYRPAQPMHASSKGRDTWAAAIVKGIALCAEFARKTTCGLLKSSKAAYLA